MNAADMADEIARLRKERDELKVKQVCIAAECKAWCDMAMALANRYPVDSQTFDYMDEIRETDWGKVLERRDARMKTEALVEAMKMCKRVANDQNYLAMKHTEVDRDGDEMVVGLGVGHANQAHGALSCMTGIKGVAAEYRKQAEGE